MTNYQIAKMLYMNGKSLRQIELELGIDRKKLSKQLKKDNVIVQKGINSTKYKKACELYKTGYSITNIAKKLKIDRHTLSKKMESDKIRKTLKRHNRNTNYDNKIIEFYNNNYSIEKISLILSISTNMVWNCLRENNVCTKKSYRKYLLNEDTFEIINTEEKAYWLGFLYADGYIDEFNGKIELSLQEKDYEHLKKFKHFLGFSGNIYKKKVYLNEKKYICYRINISSKKMSSDLAKKGCIQNKSLVLKFPTKKQVPNALIHHFMRGYFDGDGSIYIVSPSIGNGKKLQRIVEVLGTKKFLDDYMKPLYKIGINKTKYSKHGKAYGTTHGGNNQVQLIYDFLYKNAIIFLERKYTKFNCRLEPKLQKTQDD